MFRFMDNNLYKVANAEVSQNERDRYAGTKYEGTRRGEYAILSGASNSLDRQRKELNMGTGAMFARYYTMGQDGKDVLYKGEIPTENGVSIYPDEEGRYRKVDLGFAEEERKRIQQQEDYAKKILDYVSLNDDMYELFTGRKVAELGAGRDAGIQTMSEEMRAIDAKPSSINLLPENHPSRVAAYSKLFHVVKARPMMLVNASKKDDIEQGTD